MSLFNRLFQKKDQAPQDLTKERAKRLAQMDPLYILLSNRQANMLTGVSSPYIGQLEDGNRIVLLFETYQLAKDYIDRNGYDVLEGIYPIGKLSQSHLTANLATTLAVALRGGVKLMDINPSTDQVFGYHIDWFMTTNQMDKEFSMLVSEERVKGLLNQEGTTVPLTFPPILFAEFSNPYQMTDERRQELLASIFLDNSRAEDFFATFYDKQTLHDNCFVADVLSSSCIPKAEKEAKTDDLAYFKALHQALGQLVWKRLDDKKLYVLHHQKTGQLHLPNQSLHVLYTDLFKYMGHFDYRPLTSKAELISLIKENSVKYLAVTDGPHGITLIETSTILPNH